MARGPRPLRLVACLLVAGCGSAATAGPPPQQAPGGAPQQAGPASDGVLAGLQTVEPTPGGLDERGVVVSREAGDRDALQRIPFQVWPAVPGHVVGLLYVSGPQGWGATFEHGRGLATEPTRVEYKFGFDRSSPFAEYFVSPQGVGFNPLRNWNPSGPPHDVAMFTQTTPNPWGLSRKAHVVELEVNDGQGAAANNIHFVVTSARVLDGTPAVPMDPERVLLGLRARFERTAAQATNDIGPEMQRTVAEARARGATTDGTTNRIEGLWPTWVRDSSTLEALFVVRAAYSNALPGQMIARPCPPCPCARDANGDMTCAPCARCDPTPVEQHATVIGGWDLAVLDRVDARGRLVAETVYGPRPMPVTTVPPGMIIPFR